MFKSKVDTWLIIVMAASTLLVAGACFSIDNADLLAYIINIVLVAVFSLSALLFYFHTASILLILVK